MPVSAQQTRARARADGSNRTHSASASSTSASSSPSPSSSSPASAPTAPDQRRYIDFRSGVSIEELATRENVRIATVQSSIDRVISYRGRFSQEEAELAARQLFLQTAPKAAVALGQALEATKTRTKTELVLRRDPMTGTDEWTEQEIEVAEPDHKTRLSAIESRQRILASLMPKQPMVQVDARTQVNNPGLPGGSSSNLSLLASSSGPLSAEAIIFAIRKERGLATNDQLALAGSSVEVELKDRDFELEREIAEDGELIDSQDSVSEVST